MQFAYWLVVSFIAIAAAPAALAQGGPACPTVSVPPTAELSDFKSLPHTVRDTQERMTGVLWFQTAAKYQVGSLVKYRQATAALDRALAVPNWTAAAEQTATPLPKPTAVIMDLAETVLDNSLFQGELVRRQIGYDDNVWSYWVSMENAGLVPGALQFIQYAQSKGVKVFFVTNRTKSQEPNTRNNLTKLGIRLPDPATLDTVLTRKEMTDWTSDKSTRRAFVAKGCRILLLLGDDLGDFISPTPPSLPPRRHRRTGRRWLRNIAITGGLAGSSLATRSTAAGRQPPTATTSRSPTEGCSSARTSS